MVLPLYLAMTAQEMTSAAFLPPRIAYMGCHFSPSGPGLTNLPRDPLPGHILILDDQLPFQHHSISAICGQLERDIRESKFESLLLDFQRQDTENIPELITALEDALPCPVAVSHLYAGYTHGPVFLPPIPPDAAVEATLSPWQGREIWLEASLDTLCLTVTAQGCAAETLWEHPGEIQGFPCPNLHCRCRAEILEDKAVFHLERTWEDLQALLDEAASLGVRRAVGLWQELG